MCTVKALLTTPKGLTMAHNFAQDFANIFPDLSCRHQRKYHLFAGLWFGTSKPHFQTFMQPFANVLNDLFHKGKVISSTCKLFVIINTQGISR